VTFASRWPSRKAISSTLSPANKARLATVCRLCGIPHKRHSYGSLLAAAGVDLVTIKEMMGHSALSTTGRYLHARPASEQAAAFTRVFEPADS
jgi:site-specific recombinase XerD